MYLREANKDCYKTWGLKVNRSDHHVHIISSMERISILDGDHT